MKLTTMTQVTIDGVMQGNGGADDRRNGFTRGGWARGKGDDETRAFIKQAYERADAFLFGRRTYELFAGSWGSGRDVPGWTPVVRALNTRPKYVASTTLADPAWSGTTVLSDDLATAIAHLKAKPGGELQVHGSGTLIRWLLEHDLIDEMTLIVVPVVLGQGARLFPDAGRDLALDLVESRVDSKGVTIQVFSARGGVMQYLLSVIHDPAGLNTPDEMAAIDVFNDRLQAEGHWVFAGGLASPDTATVIDNRGGEAMVTDGPFLESKEYLGGFWVIEAPDLDVALKLAAEGSKQCNRKVEVRPFV